MCLLAVSGPAPRLASIAHAVAPPRIVARVPLHRATVALMRRAAPDVDRQPGAAAAERIHHPADLENRSTFSFESYSAPACAVTEHSSIPENPGRRSHALEMSRFPHSKISPSQNTQGAHHVNTEPTR
jgi:hypothetical protein